MIFGGMMQSDGDLYYCKLQFWLFGTMGLSVAKAKIL